MFSNNKFLVLILLISITSPALSGYDEALDMINRGEFIEAIEELKPLVELGYPPALYHQATLYENGQGVQRDQAKAFELYERAANRGIAESQFAIAQMYLEGRGCTKDTTQGFEYTRRAADKGLATAQYNLALMYQKGEVITQSYRNAAIWYKDAAMQNFALAQFNLALLYFDGLGVSKDLEMSYIWNRVAAFNGYKPAETSMNMDSKSLSREQIKSARARADELYLKITPDEQNYKPFSFDG